jgi:isopenicillin N synthase-like dioxygenase
MVNGSPRRPREAGSMVLPIVDAGPLLARAPERSDTAARIGAACRDTGFFYVVGHGVDPALEARLDGCARRFFARDLATKTRISMDRAGRAWRGYFPVGGELTSGLPDQKEGLYFGSELPSDHPRVRAGVPLHGPNLFPADDPEFRAAVLDYMAALTGVGHALMEGIALSLGLAPDTFAARYTANQLVLFRIFHYPPQSAYADCSAPPLSLRRWGVGEHTDYGLLTILKQDDAGGLQVKSGGQWIDVPFVWGSFVCNIGDMLDRMTGGAYRSTPHRVRNASGRSRLSFPFFFDPDFDAEIARLPVAHAGAVADRAERWDGENVHELTGTYGDYLLRKVGRVFPELRSRL